MPQESFKGQKEKPPKKPPEKPWYDFLEHAEGIRFALEIEEQPERWETLLAVVVENIQNPAEAKVSALEHEVLKRRYMDLDKHRLELGTVLRAVASFVRAKQKVSPLTQEAVKRTFARYLEERHMYSELWKGKKIPSSVALPKYLAQYVLPPEGEEFALGVMEKLLPMQYDVLERNRISAKPRDLAPLANELALMATRRGLLFESILSCLDSDGSLRIEDEPFEEIMSDLGNDDWSQDEMNALKLLVGFIGKHLEAIRRYGESTPSITLEKLRVGEVLDCCIGSSALAQLLGEVVVQSGEFFEGFQFKFPNVRTIAKKLFEDKELYAGRVIHAVLTPLAKLDPNASDEQKQRHVEDMQVVSGFFLSGQAQIGTIRNAERYVDHLTNNQQDMVRNLCDRLIQPESIEKILASLFIPREPKDRDDIEKRTAVEVEKLLKERKLSFRDAFEVYYLMEIGSSGSLPLGYKAMTLLEKNDNEDLAIELEARQISKLVDIASSTSTELQEELSGMALTDEQKREMHNLARYLEDRGVGELGRWWKRYWAYHKQFPWLFAVDAGLGGGVISSGALAGNAIWRKVNLREIAAFTQLKPHELRMKYPKVDPQMLKAAQKEARNLLTSYETFRFRVRPWLGRATRKEALAFVRAVKSGEVGELVKAFRTAYPDIQDCAPKIAEIVGNNEAVLRHWLKEAGYSQEHINAGVRSVTQLGHVENLGKIEVPDGAEKIIKQQAANEAEALKMRRGVSAFAKVAVGIDVLLLVYEVYSVAQLWKEVGELEEQQGLNDLMREATEKKKCVLWEHSASLAVDTLASGAGAFHVLSGGKLALLSTGVGTFAIIAIPIAMTLRAGMYESLADFELQQKIDLTDRIEGLDVKILKRSHHEQLRELGRVPMTLRVGAAFSRGTITDIEKLNQDEREEVILAMVASHLRESAFASYRVLLKKLGENGLRGLQHHEFTEKVLLPYIGNGLTRLAQAKTKLDPDKVDQIRTLNIRKGWFSTYFTEEELYRIIFDAAHLLGSWAREKKNVLPNMEETHALVEKHRSEKIEGARKQMQEAFGSHAERVLSMPIRALVELRQEHANVLVDIQYFDNAVMPHVERWRKMTNFAGDRTEGIPLIRVRLDALNAYLLSQAYLPKLTLEASPRSQYEHRWSPDHAFLKAGIYRVFDRTVEETGGSYGVNSYWYNEAVHRYRSLLGKFE